MTLNITGTGMSRWDALKPSSGDETKSRRPHANKIKPGDAARRWARGDEKNVVNGSVEREQYETLFRSCQRQLETEKVASLANEVIKGNASVVSQAFHSVKVVDEVFLPYLEKLIQEQERLSLSQEEERGLSAAVQAIHALLDNSSHNSSIMAPLVSEIQSDGIEIQISNPTRIRLFRDLQSILLEPDRSTPIVLERVTQSLVMALKVAKRIEGTVKHAKSKNYDLDPSAVYKFFAYSRSRSLRSTDPDLVLGRLSLELMKSLLKRHPEASCTFTTLLLIGDHTSTEQNAPNKSCKICGYGQCGPISTFLDMLHEPGRRFCSREVCLAVDVVKAVLENAPLSSWIQQQQADRKLRQQSDRRGQLVTTTASGFRERLSQGLENLIRITKCRIIKKDSNSDNDAMMHTTILAGCIFRRVPINGGAWESATLHKACSDLVQTTANLCNHSSPQAQQAAIKALLEGMGGSVSPQGELTSMSFLIKDWLSGEKGGAFATAMTHSLLQTVRTGQQNKGIHAPLVRAMMRTFPDLFLKNKDRWDALVEYILTCSESTTRQEGALALQSLMKGRKDFGSCVVDSHPITDSVVPILQIMLKSNDITTSTRCAVVSAYGCLLPNDWYLLATVRPRMDQAHINLLLDIARESQTSNKVQSEACKAIGDVCTNYFSTTGKSMDNLWYDTESTELCRTILDTLMTLLEPNNCEVSIRASAILAIGNLAHALRDASIPPQFPETVSLLPARLLAEMVDDRDAKITGNAIRALGHVTCLLFREDYNITLSSLDFDQKGLLRSSIQALTSRIRSAILLAWGELPNLNWKQRSTIKKHGWGACNSLASIFCAGVVSSIITNDRDEADDDDDILRDCLSTLLQCVEESHKVHEKVVISSMIALRSLDSSTLSRHCSRQHLSLAKALVVCLTSVCTEQDHDSTEVDQEKRLSSTKFIDESALLLRHLLESCSTTDAADAIRSQSVTKPLLDHLYQWMVEKDCPARVFDTFALAMQKPHVQVDVQTEQRFASRAMSLLSPHDDQADEL